MRHHLLAGRGSGKRELGYLRTRASMLSMACSVRIWRQRSWKLFYNKVGMFSGFWLLNPQHHGNVWNIGG